MKNSRPVVHAAVLLAAALALPALAAAQDRPAAPEEAADTFELEGLVVTATRVPQPREAVTADVTVLDGAELAARGVEHVLEALRTVPGAAIVQSGSFGGTTSLFLRGGESDYVQVLVDGVPVNRPGGAYDFASLTTDAVERIEIVRGPASVLYGSDAVSGVVHVITRGGGGEPRAAAAFRGGSFGTRAWDASVSGGGDVADYSFAASRFATDGIYAFNNEYRNTVLSGRVRLRPDDRTRATLSLRYTDDEYHYPTDSQGALVDENAFDFEDGVTLGLDMSRFIGDRLEARVRMSAHEVDAGVDDRLDGPADTLGFFGYRSLQDVSRRGVDAHANYHATPTTVLTAGAELEQQTQRSFNESQSQFGPSTGSLDVERRNRGYYAQGVTRLGRLSLNAGVRMDDNDAFGTFTTYRAGAAYALPTGTRIRAAAGTGFKEPTFLENYAEGFTRGNPDLEPEESDSWEVGLEQRLADGRVTVEATYFDQAFENLIQYTAAPESPEDPNFHNLAAAAASGLELTARAALAAALDVAISYSYLETDTRDAGFESGPDAAFVEGAPLLRRPTHSATARLGWRPGDRVRLHLDASHVGEREDRDFSEFPAPRVTLEPYTRVDLGGEFDVLAGGGPGVTLTLRVQNLLDASYQEVMNFPARGRTVLVGVRANAGF